MEGDRDCSISLQSQANIDSSEEPKSDKRNLVLDEIQVELLKYKRHCSNFMNILDAAMAHVTVQIISIFDSIKSNVETIDNKIEKEVLNIGEIMSDRKEEAEAYIHKYVTSDLASLITNNEELKIDNLDSLLAYFYSRLNGKLLNSADYHSKLSEENARLIFLIQKKDREHQEQLQICQKANENLQVELTSLKNKYQTAISNSASREETYQRDIQNLFEKKQEKERELEKNMRNIEILKQELESKSKKHEEDITELLKSIGNRPSYSHTDIRIDKKCLEIEIPGSSYSSEISKLKKFCIEAAAENKRLKDEFRKLYKLRRQEKEILIKSVKDLEIHNQQLHDMQGTHTLDYTSLWKIIDQKDKQLNTRFQQLETRVNQLENRIKTFRGDYNQSHVLVKAIEDLKNSTQTTNEVIIDMFKQVMDIKPSNLPILSFGNLTTLNLSHSDLRPEGIEAISKFRFPHLSSLDLKYNYIQSKGLLNLSKCYLPELTNLNLRGNEIDSSGIAALTRCSFPKLKSLNLRYNDISTEGLEALRFCSFEGLNTLNLKYNDIGPSGVQILSKCSFKSLVVLKLGGNIIGSKGLEGFIACDFPCLAILDLSENKIDTGTHHLLKCKFTQLEVLNLRENIVESQDIDTLRDCYRSANIYI